ncbi:MAG: FAD-dependent oxidoreductase [Gemmataceae bacterium]
MSDRPTLVVMGSGLAGARLVEETLRRAPDRFHIRMFGAEPHGTYNRILLSQVLGGFEGDQPLWLNTREWYEERGVFLHAGVRVDSIDLDKQVVVGGHGRVTEPYDTLVVATGSKAFLPKLAGADKPGVFVFRTLEDCERIAEHARDCERAVVLGGGLLGLEAARGLLGLDLDVTVLELAGHLMPQQLDEAAGKLLQRKLEDMGIEVRTRSAATSLIGDECVTGVALADGTVIETDMVVISCGICPNVAEARAAGLHVERAIVVDDQLMTSDDRVFALGECAQHRGRIYGLVDPIYEQARVLADVLTGRNADAQYAGSKPSATLKVMGVDLVSMGEVDDAGEDKQVYCQLDQVRGVYRKLVLREEKLVGAILLGSLDNASRLTRLYREEERVADAAALLSSPNSRDALLEEGGDADLACLPDNTQICNCNEVSKKTIMAAIAGGAKSVAEIGKCTKAGTGCGTCQPLLSQLLAGANGQKAAPVLSKLELMKQERNGLDIAEALAPLMKDNRWQEMSDDDKQLSKWRGLFFRKPTPGHFMLRLRFNAGQATSEQFRVIADLSDEFGKGFCDLTTRQQIQLRWFTLSQIDEIWQRLEAVGLNTLQTGADNVRGVCGCPVAGLTPHELFDATPVVDEYTRAIVGNREFTNLPRKFNVTVTGCLENCCHTETQDIALVPAYRELEGRQVNGFNVLVGGKQGSGGYTPAQPLDVFVRQEQAVSVCIELTRIFRDHGARSARNRARLAFLIQDRGLPWLRSELEKRLHLPLLGAGSDLRKKHHVDHVGIHPQKRDALAGEPPLHYLGMVVPVGRITTEQLRGVARLADDYGNGSLRLTVGQNIVIPNIPEARIGALTEEPIFKELPFDPSPIMRGLVACTGNDYCPMALIDTKGYAIEVARELEKRTAHLKLKPLTINWSGCPAGCGLHQVASIGMQGCRSRVDGQIVDAAHVCINGRAGPEPRVATDVLYDVPISRLPDALDAFVAYLPRI